MKWNVFPNYRIPIDYISYDNYGVLFVEHVAWIITPDIELLKQDSREHVELVVR